MTWRKIGAAAEYAGGLSVNTIYRAISRGDLRAARIGAGRNLLTCDRWLDEWLRDLAPETTADARVEETPGPQPR